MGIGIDPIQGLQGLVNMGIGIGQTIKAKKLERKADAIDMPTGEDLNQRAYLDNLIKMRRRFEVGQDAGSLVARNLLRQNTAGLIKSIGRNVRNPNTILALSDKMGADMLEKSAVLSQNTSENIMKSNQLIGQQVNYIGETKKNLQLWKKIQAMREAATMRTSANQNLASGFNSLIGSVSIDPIQFKKN